jgi:RimJ/RimL family protein N-acetyltransferase
VLSKNQPARQKDQSACGQALPLTVLRIRSLVAADESKILSWANDKNTRENAVHSKPISPRTHKAWFRSILKSPESHQGFLCVDGRRKGVGVIRFSRQSPQDKVWEIHFNLAPEWRGKGLARPMLEKALTRFKKQVTQIHLMAKVKVHNLKSLHLLKSIGFRKIKNVRGLWYLSRTPDSRTLLRTRQSRRCTT